MLPAQQVEAVKEHADIVRVIGEHVSLRKSGANFIGLCPFHDERTASFHVNVTTNRAHCFGCQWNGDVFAFLQAAEKVSFSEAVRKVAALTGVALDNLPASEAEKLRQERELERRRAEAYAHAERKLQIELADELDWLRKLRRKADECIAEGRKLELAWSALQFVAYQLPRTDTAYMIVAFAEAETRMKFVLRPGERDTLIAEALDRGFVRGESNHTGHTPVWEIPCL